MHALTVRPVNYAVENPENIDNHNSVRPNGGCSPTRRFLRFCTFIVVVGIAVICAIVLPLVLNSSRDKNTFESTTTKSTNDTFSQTSTSTALSNTSNTTNGQLMESNDTSTTASHLNTTTTSQSMISSSSNTTNDQLMENNNTSTTASHLNTTTTNQSMISSSSNTTNDQLMESNNTSTTASHLNTTIVNNSLAPAMSSTDDVQSMASMDTSTKSSTTENKTTIASSASQLTERITTSRPLIHLNNANDTVVAVYNTTAGRANGGFNGTDFNTREGPWFAMDGKLTTKYFNRGIKGSPNSLITGYGIGTGFIVIPSISNSTVARGIYFATADDRETRDPLTVTLEGSNASAMNLLNNGSSWTLIYNGTTGIAVNEIARKQQYGTQEFENTKQFASYRLLVTSTRNKADGTQYSEARIMGYL